MQNFKQGKYPPTYYMIWYAPSDSDRIKSSGLIPVPALREHEQTLA